jgi:hypothetical protein
VERFRSLIDQAAQRHHLDAALLAAVVHVESGGNPQAVSPAGAQGLTQLIPATANVLESTIRLISASLDARQHMGRRSGRGGDVSKAPHCFRRAARGTSRNTGDPLCRTPGLLYPVRGLPRAAATHPVLT